MTAAEQGEGLSVAASAKRISNHRNRIEGSATELTGWSPAAPGFHGDW